MSFFDYLINSSAYWRAGALDLDLIERETADIDEPVPGCTCLDCGDPSTSDSAAVTQ
jgi:hypothetical protein